MSGGPTFTPGGVPDGPRRRTQASTRLLHEWSLTQAWEVPPIYEMRLGPTPLSIAAPVVTPALEGMLRRANRYADMIGITSDELQVIEAKMVAEPGAISQLQHYLDLTYATPILQQHPGKRIQGVLLWAVNDVIVQQRANAAGLRVITWTPPWTQDYLATQYYRR